MGGDDAYEEETKRELPMSVTSNIKGVQKPDKAGGYRGEGGPNGKQYVLPLPRIECKLILVFYLVDKAAEVVKR